MNSKSISRPIKSLPATTKGKTTRTNIDAEGVKQPCPRPCKALPHMTLHWLGGGVHERKQRRNSVTGGISGRRQVERSRAFDSKKPHDTRAEAPDTLAWNERRPFGLAPRDRSLTSLHHPRGEQRQIARVQHCIFAGDPGGSVGGVANRRFDMVVQQVNRRSANESPVRLDHPLLIHAGRHKPHSPCSPARSNRGAWAGLIRPNLSASGRDVALPQLARFLCKGAFVSGGPPRCWPSSDPGRGDRPGNHARQTRRPCIRSSARHT